MRSNDRYVAPIQRQRQIPEDVSRNKDDLLTVIGVRRQSNRIIGTGRPLEHTAVDKHASTIVDQVVLNDAGNHVANAVWADVLFKNPCEFEDIRLGDTNLDDVARRLHKTFT